MTERLKKRAALQVYKGSIVDCYTDAVVIPSTAALEWEPEVANELTRKAGPTAVAAARRKAPLDVGEAMVTTSGGMLACFIIHVALPRPPGLGDMTMSERHELLDAAVKNALLRCAELSVPSVGLPNLGRWLGFSAAESARLIVAALDDNLPEEGVLEEIHLVLGDSAEVSAFSEAAFRARP